jgi:O-antigen biosynthesis protein
MGERINMKKKPQVSIVIPQWKGYDELYKCLASIPEAMGNVSYELIVVSDGNPRDDDNEKMHQYIEKECGGQYIRLLENGGYPSAVNAGAKIIRADILYVLTVDVVLSPNSGEHLFNNFVDEKIGMAGMKLLFMPDSDDPARPAGMLQHIGLHMNIRGEVVHTFVGWHPDNPRVLAVRDVMAVTGAAFMIRRSIWDAIDGFWEGYGRGTYEDIETAMHTRKMGYNIVVEQNAVAFHDVGITVTKYGGSFPLSDNYVKFVSRWKNDLEYWEHKVL